MASMTVEFLKVKLLKSSNKKEEDYKKIKELLTDIFKVECTNNGEYQSLDLSPYITPKDVEPKEIMDLFSDEKYLFGRICRKKANNAILKRNYETLEAEDVFTDAESAKRGIEVFTFFIYDYNQGILAMVNTKAAPGARSLNAIFDNYCPKYTLSFTSIPNEEGINVLYKSERPEISKLEFEIPSPNAEFLQRVLNLPEDDIGEIIQSDVMTATILLKPVPYGKLISKKNTVRRVLDILIEKRKYYSKAIVKGCSEKFNSRNFDLQAKYFTYPIEIRRYRTVRGEKVEYTLNEIIGQFKLGLHTAYEENYDLINAIAER